MASSARTSMEYSAIDKEYAPPTSSPSSLSKAVHARRSEFTQKRQIKVKIGSWNVAACPGTERDLEDWFVNGKGVAEQLSGVKFFDGAEDLGKDGIESVEAQEARQNKRESTLPKGDPGLMPGGQDIDLYVLGLQEVVDLNSAREYVGRVYTDSGPTTKWRNAMINSVPKGYLQIAEQQLSGLLLLIFASPGLAPSISSVSTVSTGTGIMGYLGNKGAIACRIVLGETTRMVFVNSHLASGSDPTHLERRCWDVTQILQRTQFDPINWSGVLDESREGIGEEDFAFWFGDLNFRLDGLPGDDIRRLLMLHTRGEYDIGHKSRSKIESELGVSEEPIVIHSIESDDDSEEELEPSRGTRRITGMIDKSSGGIKELPDPDDFVQDPSQDPASLQATLDSLIPHDQLKNMQKKQKAFHDGWREGPITFMPTYKYDVGSVGMFDSSEKRRAPSWCDRILFRTRRDKLEYERKRQEEELARIKDEEMKARGIDRAGDDEDVLFNYTPDEDGAEESSSKHDYNEYDEYDEYDEDGAAGQPEALITKEGSVDSVKLDFYTSHQRVLSSDHKPLDAVFTIEYDAVVPELKATIQAEVAKELDRAENEGRPGITIVVEHPQETLAKSGRSLAREPSAASVDFGPVAYLQRKSCGLTFANTGQVPATFFFVGQPSASGEEDNIAPPWLSVSFIGSDSSEEWQELQKLKREITLEPGDAVNATLKVLIDELAFVQALNAGTAELDDILVLRVTDGRDHFIPIRGTWLQSCFGRSIDELIRIPEGGVRALLPRDDGSNGFVNRGQAVCWPAPRELLKLTEAVDTLTDRVIADANMIVTVHIPKDAPGWPFDRNSWLLKDFKARETLQSCVLEALDSDKDLVNSFPPETPAIEKLEIMSEVLIMFLNSLKDGIVPEDIWKNIEQDMIAHSTKPVTDPEEIKTWILDVLSNSPNHNISFVFLTSMLSRVAGELVLMSKAPVPWKDMKSNGTRSSMDTVRRSLSWKGRPPSLLEDPTVSRRLTVEKAYVDVFRDVVFRGGTALKDKEKRVLEDRRREVFEPFLRGVIIAP